MSYTPWPPAPMNGYTWEHGTLIGMDTKNGAVITTDSVVPIRDGTHWVFEGDGDPVSGDPGTMDTESGLVTGLVAGTGSGNNSARVFCLTWGGPLALASGSPCLYNIFKTDFNITKVVFSLGTVAVSSEARGDGAITLHSSGGHSVGCGTSAGYVEFDTSADGWTFKQGECLYITIDAVADSMPGADLSVELYGEPS